MPIFFKLEIEKWTKNTQRKKRKFREMLKDNRGCRGTNSKMKGQRAGGMSAPFVTGSLGKGQMHKTNFAVMQHIHMAFDLGANSAKLQIVLHILSASNPNLSPLSRQSPSPPPLSSSTCRSSAAAFFWSARTFFFLPPHDRWCSRHKQGIQWPRQCDLWTIIFLNQMSFLTSQTPLTLIQTSSYHYNLQN